MHNFFFFCTIFFCIVFGWSSFANCPYCNYCFRLSVCLYIVAESVRDICVSFLSCWTNKRNWKRSWLDPDFHLFLNIIMLILFFLCVLLLSVSAISSSFTATEFLVALISVDIGGCSAACVLYAVGTTTILHRVFSWCLVFGLLLTLFGDKRDNYY